MEDCHPVPGRLTIRQVDSGGGNGIIWCRDAHDTTACLDIIKRHLVICRWLPCADEGDGPLSSRSRTTGHNSETMPVRDQQTPKRLAHPTSTDKRNVIAGSDRLHTVSPGRKPTPSLGAILCMDDEPEASPFHGSQGYVVFRCNTYIRRQQGHNVMTPYIRGSAGRTPQPLWAGALPALRGYRSWP